MKVEYKTGCIEITTDAGFYRISEIVEIYLICDLIKSLLDNCTDEKSHRAYAFILDILSAAKNKLIQYHETKTCPYPYYGYPAPTSE
jgi:hypothetical protein